MTRTPTPYTPRYYDERLEPTVDAARVIVPMVMDLVEPASVVDIGCGVGVWLEAFHAVGVEDIRGMDGPWIRPDMVRFPSAALVNHDLRRPLVHDRTFDLAVSIEVAEHLPAENAASFIDALATAAPIVLFSAAIPGQGGTDHVNEQYPSYWRPHFARHGHVLLDVLRSALWDREDVSTIYRQNPLLFVREDVLAAHAKLAAARSEYEAPVDLVHPRMLRGAVASAGDVRRIAVERAKRSLGPARPVARWLRRSLAERRS